MTDNNDDALVTHPCTHPPHVVHVKHDSAESTGQHRRMMPGGTQMMTGSAQARVDADK
jgi:hypothetical protein